MRRGFTFIVVLFILLIIVELALLVYTVTMVTWVASKNIYKKNDLYW
ncbi:YjcZ family sporulation protein [Peribacillus simplex]